MLGETSQTGNARGGAAVGAPAWGAEARHRDGHGFPTTSKRKEEGWYLSGSTASSGTAGKSVGKPRAWRQDYPCCLQSTVAEGFRALGEGGFAWRGGTAVGPGYA